VALSVEYVVKETSSNLWRNRVVSLAAVVVVTLSLSLFGVALLFRQAVSNATVRWSGGVTLAIFMNMNATDGQLNAIKTELSQNSEVKTANFCNQPCALTEYKKIFSSDPTMLGAITSSDQLPVSFRITLQNADTATSFGSQFQDQPGVQTVEYAKDQINQNIIFFRVLQTIALVVAAALLATAVLLILISIRLAIFARRKEVGVMKLVGATNWFIRIPFMAEGLVQGILGAGFGCVLMWFVRIKLSSMVAENHNTVIGSFSISASNLFETQIILMFIGILIGGGGSAIALRRFLDV
jgi:cell division transport system permease protein